MYLIYKIYQELDLYSPRPLYFSILNLIHAVGWILERCNAIKFSTDLIEILRYIILVNNVEVHLKTALYAHIKTHNGALS